MLDNDWKVIESTNTYVKIKGPEDEILYCRTQVGFDLTHIVEIFIDESYGTDFKGKNVIDIGMSNGDSSIFFAKNGAKRVIGIEADRRSFDIALTNLNESKVDGIVFPLNKALSERTGMVELIVSASSPNANSIDEKNMVNVAGPIFKENIESISLKEVIDMYNGENIDFLKMDCEGCEYQVLRTISKMDFSKILNLSLEYHHGLQDIPKLLNMHGFDIKITKRTKLVGYIWASKKPL
ncbi:MAG: FkbM family methyltransferase [Thermoplasmatales archaeon]|nr:MAG: FkbM family methyltransferase [Thermoplasmatales archaeon]